MYIIQRRYQYLGSKEVKWTSWFNHSRFPQKEDADKELIVLKKQKEPIRKLKAEYQIIESD